VVKFIGLIIAFVLSIVVGTFAYVRAQADPNKRYPFIVGMVYSGYTLIAYIIIVRVLDELGLYPD
jgi:hypothetical protein